KEPWWSKWRGWLKKGAPIPDDDVGLARQASVLVLFDYVSGNWDRFSGANVGFDKERKMLLFIDNDGAFFETPPKDGLLRNKTLLAGVDRFSRRLVRALRDAGDLEFLASAAEGGPSLLSEKVREAVKKR